MNKKGFLLGEEAIKIILAIICIVALVIFIVYIYNGYVQNQDLQNAESTLKHLVNDIQAKSSQEAVYNPGGWVLLSAPSGVSNIPKQCVNNKWNTCLCLCDSSSNCDSKGICMQSDFSVEGTITINNPPVILSINQQTKTISKD